MKLPFRTIGIAGYMGSGKSTITRLLGNKFGYRVLEGDVAAKELMQQNKHVQQQLIAVFGDDIIENGQITFPKLGKKVFNSLENVEQLNQIVHPVLIESLRNTIFTTAGESLVLDAALLPLWQCSGWFDCCLWIDAPAAIRYARIFRKGSFTDTEELLRRIRIQEMLFSAPNDAAWRWIINDGSIEKLYNAAEQLCT